MMPNNPIYKQDKRIRGEQFDAYMDYIFRYFDQIKGSSTKLDVDALMDEFVNIVQQLVPDNDPTVKAAKIGVFNVDLRIGLLLAYAATTTDPQERRKVEQRLDAILKAVKTPDKGGNVNDDDIEKAEKGLEQFRKIAPTTAAKAEQKFLGLKYAAYCGMKGILQDGAFLVDAGDAARYNFHLVNPDDIGEAGVTQIAFERKKSRLSRTAHNFKLRCDKLMEKHPALANDESFKKAYEDLIKLTDKIHAQKDSVWAGIAGEGSKYIDDFIKQADKVDRLMHKQGVYAVEEDLAYIDLLHSLYLFRSDFTALMLAISHAVSNGGYYFRAAAYKAWKAMAYAAGAAIAAASAAIGYPRRKVNRLLDQGILNAFKEEGRRFWAKASKIFATEGGYWKALTEARAGSFLKKPLDVFTGVGMRGAVLMLYVPTKVMVGAMNERYNFINQVKLGVTGSYLDKRAMRDDDGKPMFKIGKTADSKKSNNKLLMVQTADYDPAKDSGAAAIIKKGTGGHDVLFIAHDEQAGKNLLELLCKAVKDSDSTKLIIETVNSDPDSVEVQMVNSFIKSLEDNSEYKKYQHIDIVVNDVSMNELSREKSRPRS